MKNICLFVLLFMTMPLMAQIKLADLSQTIECPKQTVKYAAGFETDSCRYFQDLRPSVDDTFDRSKYSRHDGTYLLQAPIEKVWQTCMTISPSELWTGKRILSLTFIYDHKNEKLLTEYANYSLDSSQIYFINLRVIWGLYNLPTALMVTKVDEASKTIIFTYLKNGKSEGRQVLHFEPEGTGTRIIHTTHFASGSHFRDKRLYPYFHQKTITELHKNIDSFSMKQ